MNALGIALIVGGLTLICGGLVFLLFRRDEPPISQESFEQDGPVATRHERHLGERRGAREAEQNDRPRALSIAQPSCRISAASLLFALAS